MMVQFLLIPPDADAVSKVLRECDTIDMGPIMPCVGETVVMDEYQGAMTVVSVLHDLRRDHEGPRLIIAMVDAGRLTRKITEKGGAPL